MGKRLIVLIVLLLGIIICTFQALVEVPDSHADITPELNRTAQNLSALNFQDLIDKAAQAALNKQWPLCSYYLDTLQDAWDRTKPAAHIRLELINEVDQQLDVLHALVLTQNQSEFIKQSTQLTRMFAQILTQTQQRE